MDPRFFRQYLDILNEGPPAGVGPNAPRPTAPQQLGQHAFTKMLPGMGNKAIDAGKSLVNPYGKAMADFTPGSPYYEKHIANNPATKAKVDAFTKTAPSAAELGASIDQTRQSFNQALAAKPEVGGEVTAKEAKNSAGPGMFREYLNMLDEQPVTANIDDNTSVAANPTAKTVTAQTKIGDLDLKATRDNSAIPATQLSANYQVDPNAKVGVTHTQKGYRGQMTPTTQLTANFDSPDVGKVDLQLDKGAMFQGAGKNIQPGNPAITTSKFTTPQGQSATYSTNRNL